MAIQRIDQNILQIFDFLAKKNTLRYLFESDFSSLTTKHRKDVCDTTFENLNIILLHSDNNLGTIRVPHGTEKAQYVKHIKLNTVERGNFDFLAITNGRLITPFLFWGGGLLTFFSNLQVRTAPAASFLRR